MNEKVVVITGAIGVLGELVAQDFAHRGARIILIDKAANPSAEVRGIGRGDRRLAAGHWAGLNGTTSIF